MYNYLKQKYFFKGLLLLLLIIVSFTSCFKNLTKVTVLYQSDFENYNMKPIEVSGWLNGNFAPVTDVKIIDFNGNKVLGRFNSNLVSLTLPDLPAHTAISVEFDLYIHDNWKNDLWKITFDGVDQLLTGFSNDPNVQQAFPNWLNAGGTNSPAGTNAENFNLPGACALASSMHGTSKYKITRTVLHSGNSFQLNCSDAGDFLNQTCQRSWSIDNLKISAISN